MRALTATEAGAAFDRRLDPATAAPLAVAFSGGGDSLAALLAAKAWADRCGRRVLALHVDHGLQAASGAWAEQARGVAARLGADFQRLAWTGDKPRIGLADAARRARHALIAEAARQAGARVVVFGHTADDAFEAERMRAEGSSLGRLGEWRPSPIWPAGRGVFLLRPLLAARRAALRDSLAAAGWAWIDDPANDAAASARARARHSLAMEPPMGDPPLAEDDPQLAALAEAASVDAAGLITLDREALRAAQTEAGRRWLSAALACAGGAPSPPAAPKVEALVQRLREPADVTATLAGARLQAQDHLRIAREAGAFRRAGARARLDEAQGDGAVWDGRFRLAGLDASQISPLAGRAARLPRDQRQRLRAVDAAARGALPALVDDRGVTTCPILAGPVSGAVTCLVRSRLLAACGAISNESQV